MRTTTPEEIASVLKDDFNIEKDLYTVARHSAHVLNLMGMLELKKGVLRGLVQDYCIKMPPEAVSIASVICISKPNDANWTYEIQEIYHPPQIIFRSSEDDSEETTSTEKYKDNYIPDMHYGYYPYVWECPYLKVNETNIELLVEYSEIRLDDRGFPKIPEDALDACVHYIVYKHMQPLFALGRIQMGVWQEVKSWKNQKIRQAKNRFAMRGLSRNVMNNVLNIISSFDRKVPNIDA